jgi:hypothetical protein
MITVPAIIYPITTFITTIYAVSGASWALTQLYGYICAPFTFWGLLMMPIQMGSPFCQIINFTQYELGKHYIGIFIATGASILSFMGTSSK